MKKNFRGYYPLSEDEIKEIWKNGFISFDTNILFNLYRYSDETRTELLKIIKKYSKQIFLSYHSAYEFHKNRTTVISEQITIYDETIKAFTKLENDIIKNLKTPHLSKETLENFKTLLTNTTKDLESKKNFFIDLLKNDTILESISKIFIDSKIGKQFTKEEIMKIEKEGIDRYQNKIPPGYKDNDKKANKYGDLIIWKELLRESKSKSKSFIFILDDVKEDWWLRVNGQTLSPRPELSQESFEESGQLLYLYTTDRFLEFASQSEQIQQETIEEVREINHWQNTQYSEFYKDIIDNSERLRKNTTYSQLIMKLKKLSEMNDKLSNQISFDYNKSLNNDIFNSVYNKIIKDENIKNDDDNDDDDVQEFA